MVGEIEERSQLTDLILNSSEQSIFFSHRIWFFIQSLLYVKNEEGEMHKKKSLELLHGLQRVVIKTEELLCLVNSVELV
jgi:hypothetical protein